MSIPSISSRISRTRANCNYTKSQSLYTSVNILDMYSIRLCNVALLADTQPSDSKQYSHGWRSLFWCKYLQDIQFRFAVIPSPSSTDTTWGIYYYFHILHVLFCIYGLLPGSCNNHSNMGNLLGIRLNNIVLLSFFHLSTRISRTRAKCNSVQSR